MSHAWKINFGKSLTVLQRTTPKCINGTRQPLSTLLIYLRINLARASLSSSLQNLWMKASTMLPIIGTSTTSINRHHPSWRLQIKIVKRSVESQSPGCIWACNFQLFAGMSKTFGWIPSIIAIEAPQKLGTLFLRAINRNLMLMFSKRLERGSF